MDIKTKYNIGDKVFYVDQNVIKRGVINGIVFIAVSKHVAEDALGNVLSTICESEESYKIGYDSIPVSCLFGTKEELINSLKDETDNNK